MTEKKPNILIVDDEEYICNIIRESLVGERCNVQAMTDPKAALEYIREHPLDLVLTDLVMGEYSGVQIIDEVKRHHHDAIVILMTAHPTVQTAISVLKKGCYDFMVKPFKLEQLKAAIKRGLEHQRVRRDNLSLQGQVEFLKIINATEAGVEIDKFLELVAKSCRKELDAESVGIIQIDPDSRDIIRKVTAINDSKYRAEVTADDTLNRFVYTRSTEPYIFSEEIKGDNGTVTTRTFFSSPIFVRRKLYGVINVVVENRFQNITPGKMNILTILTNTTASAIANHQLLNDLQRSYLQAIRGLANAIEARDPYTAGHTDRVSKLAELVARHLKWDEDKILDLIMGCTLHDIGKIGVPDSVLNKPDRLDEREIELMRSHPEVGLKIVDGIDLFKPAIPIIMSHHEHFDGNGYPNALAGEQIPVEGRLLAVVDTFDAILSDRPYRQGATLKVAVTELIRNRGKQFDPSIVDVLLGVIRAGEIDFETMYGRVEDLSVLDQISVTETAPA